MHDCSAHRTIIELRIITAVPPRGAAMVYIFPLPLNEQPPNVSFTVIVQLFQWNWDSIAAECAWIGANGYAYVQVSPPNESAEFTPSNWYDDYQAVSYQLISKHGNQTQFASMITTCKSHGVGILVDLIWNNMAGVDSGVGISGTAFTQYSYPGVYDSSDFHYCGTSGNQIVDWSNVFQIQNCQLSNLADLDTSSEKVRATVATYANTLVGLGVAGFRVDASKHMNTTDLSNIMSRVNNKDGLYWTHEVVDEDGSPVHASDYTDLAAFNDVQEFAYVTNLCEAFIGCTPLSIFQNISSLGWLPSDKANVFVVNHDRERSGCASGILNFASPDNAYPLAQIFSLGLGYGTPTVFSGFEFPESNPNQDAPNGGYASCDAGSGWNCEHRYVEVVGMVGFYAQVGTAAVSQWVNGDDGQVAFTRTGQGFVIINYNAAAWNATFVTGLADGTYCDVTTGSKSGKTCTGATITVVGGKIANYSVAAYSALAIHIGAKL
ncbi:hypothetical protein FRB96_008836 [Tulasnella sp. 330]|nr:hypothetical protein FRB96_008836 [Tulasnella sp. 330]KAG8882311.1 hypothetical protein FRB97_008419 [Tulasnella sp. 331]KAG8888251.1 hypothetical protein FRB98_008085 [Tulasnella sp. 332]